MGAVARYLRIGAPVVVSALAVRLGTANSAVLTYRVFGLRDPLSSRDSRLGSLKLFTVIWRFRIVYEMCMGYRRCSECLWKICRYRLGVIHNVTLRDRGNGTDSDRDSDSRLAIAQCDVSKDDNTGYMERDFFYSWCSFQHFSLWDNILQSDNVIKERIYYGICELI